MSVSQNARAFKEVRLRSGVSIRVLARAIGRQHTRLQYYEDSFKKEYLPLSVIELVAPHLVGKGTPPITADELLALAGAATPLFREDRVANSVTPPIDSPPALPSPSEMPRTVPVLGVSVGGTEGDFSMNGEVSDYARRPPALSHRRDVFAVWTVGESMVPWRRPRELVYVERGRPAVSGDHVVVELKPTPPDEVRPAFLKRLVAMTPTKLKLEQYNPARIIEIDRRRVLHVYRVLEWSEVFGL